MPKVNTVTISTGKRTVTLTGPKPKKTISKIKFDGTRVEIKYTVGRGGGEPDEYELKCRDLPHPDFKVAFEALRPFVAEICEMDEDYLEKSEVRGVSISNTNGVMGACITVLKTLKTATSPLVINTPHLPSEPYNEEQNPETAKLLPKECVEAIQDLIDEAGLYVDGKRAQGSLFGNPDETKEEKAA